MDHRRILRADAAPALDAQALVACAALRQAGTRTARIAAALAAGPDHGGTAALAAVFTGADPHAARALGHSFHPDHARG